MKKIKKIEMMGKNKIEYNLKNDIIPNMYIDATELVSKINEIIETLNKKHE